MIGITIKYLPFLSIDIYHKYFYGNICQKIKLVPDHHTSQRLQKLNLIVKTSPAHLDVAIDSEKLDALHHHLSRDNQIDLGFFIIINDPYFNNFSGLDIKPQESILYFHNQGSIHLEDKQRLHKEPTVSKKDLLSRENVMLSWLRHRQNTENILLRDHLGQEIPASSQEDLKVLPFGQYSLLVNGKDNFKLFHTRGERLPYVVGFIQITLDKHKHLQNLPHSEDSGTWKPCNFLVQFSTRHTYWKYIIIPKYLEEVEGLYIQTGEGSKIQFKGPENELLDQGIEAYSFVSNEILPLGEISDFNFHLASKKKGDSNGYAKKIKRLPTPNFKNIRIDKQSKKMYSDIRVYI